MIFRNLYTKEQIYSILASKKLPLTLPRKKHPVHFNTEIDEVSISTATQRSTYNKPLYWYISKSK